MNKKEVLGVKKKIQVRSYLKIDMQLMIKDDSLCVGAIMEAAAQMRRVTQGIGEMVNYLQYNRDILFSDSRDDIFHLFFAMAVQQSQKKQDISEIKKRLLNMVDVMTKLDVYDKYYGGTVPQRILLIFYFINPISSHGSPAYQHHTHECTACVLQACHSFSVSDKRHDFLTVEDAQLRSLPDGNGQSHSVHAYRMVL